MPLAGFCDQATHVARAAKDMEAVMRYALARLKEASTWAGIAALIPAMAVLPEPWSWLALVASLAAVVLPGGRADGER